MSGAVGAVYANNTAHDLSTSNFTQDWSNAALITANNDWSGVPSLSGFRGDALTAANDIDPQTVLAADDPGVPNVSANQANPNTLTSGGLAEFAIANPVVALQGSGTADAPYLKIYLNSTGRCGLSANYNLRDIDGSTDNAAQQVALQYRVGNTGAFTNVPAGYVADASTGPSIATQVTPIAASLPLAVENQPLVELRIMTSNATGNDEWIGIDDINVTSSPCAVPLPNISINDVTANEGNAGTSTFTFTISLDAPAPTGGVTFDIATADSSATTADNDYLANSATGATIASGLQTATFDVTVNGDTTYEPGNQQFVVNIANVVGANVANAGDEQGFGTITDDDAFPQLSASATSTVFEGNAGNSAASITYTLSNPADEDATIVVDTADGTATLADSDYVQLSSATVVIPAGATSVAYTGAQTVGDLTLEPDETFQVAVSNYYFGLGRTPNGNNLPLPTTVTIVNDDASADLSVAVTDSPDPVVPGQNITYVVTLTNAGPSDAAAASFSLPLPTGTTFVSLAQPGMWNCTTPAVGANGIVSCNDGVVTAAAPEGSAKMGVGSAQFTVVANVDMNVAPGTLLSSSVAAGSATNDPNGGNNATTPTTLVAAAAVPSVPVPALDRRAAWLIMLATFGLALVALRRQH